jgi:hypothetical protein
MSEERRYTLYGYHGTAESCAIPIDESRFFELGEPRSDHWLGSGAYFYRDDEDQAAFWAKNKVKRHNKFRGETPCVIEVLLEVNELNFLNLDTRRGLDYLKDFLSFLKTKGVKIEPTSYDNIPEKIRCFLLSLLPEEIWLIQKTFHNIPSRFDEEELFVAMELSLAGTQLCVRNNEVVKGNSIRVKRLVNPIKKKTQGKPRLLDK